VSISAAERDSNNIIEQQLSERAEAVEKAADADVLTFIGPIYQPVGDAIKDAVEAIRKHRPGLMVIIETPGGYIDVAERIAMIFRHHYRRVEFLVPSYAMSAGTVLVMSGDAIWMDYASLLGPIDPQVERNNQLVPALGYLEQYKRLVEKSAAGTLTTAELMYLVQNFDAAELYRYEQERELSIALLEEWLVKYKFKNWKVTETSKTKVTTQRRKDRAREIAFAQGLHHAARPLYARPAHKGAICRSLRTSTVSRLSQISTRPLRGIPRSMPPRSTRPKCCSRS